MKFVNLIDSYVNLDNLQVIMMGQNKKDEKDKNWYVTFVYRDGIAFDKPYPTEQAATIIYNNAMAIIEKAQK